MHTFDGGLQKTFVYNTDILTYTYEICLVLYLFENTVSAQVALIKITFGGNFIFGLISQPFYTADKE
jgi:hypothetical protein